MNNQELNNKLAELDDYHPEHTPDALKGTYKVLPYWSFGWRFVNFEKGIWLGFEPYTEDDGKPLVKHVGFCPRLKWNYTRWQSSEEERVKIKELCELFVTEPSTEHAAAIYNYLQTLKP